jgi:hypothetical protein
MYVSFLHYENQFFENVSHSRASFQLSVKLNMSTTTTTTTTSYL